MSRRGQLRPSLFVSLSQRLAMTPSLLQKIELLALNQLELSGLLRQELENNPLLDEVSESFESDATSQEQDESEQELDSLSEEKHFEELDFEYYFGEYLSSNFVRQELEASEEHSSFEQFLSSPRSLSDHLNWQLNLSELKTDLRTIAYFIIGNLDEDGYLTLTRDEICQQLQVASESVESALLVIQNMDPVGVGCRDLQECLLLQARITELEEPLVETLISQYLPLIETRKFREIIKLLRCDPDEFSRALHVIRSFSPRPGQKYSFRKPVYVRPDVHIHKVENDYQISLNDDGLPKLRLNRSYRNLLLDSNVSKEAKSFIRERIRSALELFRSVDQRQRTIYRVCDVIIQRQKGFLESGITKLRPLLIKDVANELGLHPSTISRVVANKYAHTPQGLIELRRFFSVRVESSNGESMSMMQVKETIRKFIGEENPDKPFSDQKLADMLNREGIHITRRTVAKYREQMKVRGSRERKKRDLF